MTEPNHEEGKTIGFSVKLPKHLIEAGLKTIQEVKGSYLVFLILLALLVPWALWLLSKHMNHLPLLYTYIAMVLVLAAFGMWFLLAPVRQERDRLLEDRKGLVKELRNARDSHQRCEDNLKRCLECLPSAIATKTM